MIKWTGPNKGKLRRALLEVYPNENKLRRFVCDYFNFELTGVGGNTPEDWAESLLDKASEEDWIRELYDYFCSKNLSNLIILTLQSELKDPILDTSIGGENTSYSVERAMKYEGLFEDPRSVHLVIAIFWQERNKQKIRIRPKLCYQDSNSRKISEYSFMEDEPSIMLKNFPGLFENLIDKAIEKISKLFPNRKCPWRLSIELFVPVDLIGQPLLTWCGQNREFSSTYAIVVGCSDRFNLNRPVESAKLHNQLALGWQRFQGKVPDIVGSKLSQLSWLTSDHAHQKAFTDYAGFQCYGSWLKSDEQSLGNWQELVRSGIPLALWIRGETCQRHYIESIFERLIHNTRFEFLERIPRIRDELQKTCNHCVGVFYEDPNYVPNISLSEEEYFLGWPGA
jgi:vWA-MoxR associated protein C-terminal domain/Effector-associated domain 1